MLYMYNACYYNNHTKSISSSAPLVITSTTISPIEAARSCVKTGDCRKTEIIPTEILNDVEKKDQTIKTNKRVISDRTKQQLRTQIRLCLFAQIC